MATNGSNNYGIRDNHSRGKVADFLIEKIADSSQLSVVSAYFTIYDDHREHAILSSSNFTRRGLGWTCATRFTSSPRGAAPPSRNTAASPIWLK